MTTSAFAAEPVKIGVVDLQRAVSESKEGGVARTKILQKTEQLNTELKAQVAEIEKLRSELEKDTSKLSAEIRQEKERTIQRKSRDVQNRQKEAQEEIKQMDTDLLNKILARMGVILGKIGDDGGYAVILEKGSGTIYFNRQIDVTPMVVKMADTEQK